MAVGNSVAVEMFPVNGFAMSAVEANIKYEKRLDLCVFEIAVGASVSAVFTKNAFCAAPVLIAKQHLDNRNAQLPTYLLVNTGYANAGTGQQGHKNALHSCQFLADKVDAPIDQVLPFSTGVIGEQYNVGKMALGIEACLAKGFSGDSWDEASQAILTTDTRTKTNSVQLELDGSVVTLTGVAKGSGMIRPDMATMLSYIACDADISQDLLDEIILDATQQSFNKITIDGDTSTNDAFVLVATKTSACEIENNTCESFLKLSKAITKMAAELAQAIIKDGEGATKFITVNVQEGRSTKECETVAYTVAHSPLVKTAFFASDPNWGRILAAVGRSGLEGLDVSKISIFLGNVCIVKSGGLDKDYQEAMGQAVMNEEEIEIRICLGRGELSACVWTSDLSYDYVKINAEYRS